MRLQTAVVLGILTFATATPRPVTATSGSYMGIYITFVNAQYSEFLGRFPSIEEQEHWLRHLSIGGWTQEQVRESIKNSRESAMRLVQTTYVTYLNRAPSSGELDWQVNNLLTGVISREMFVYSVATSAEAKLVASR